MPKELGGLGVKDIISFNTSLLGKWKWEMFQNQEETWSRVLESKYGGWRSLDGASRVSTESLWWRDLKIVNQSLNQGHQLNRLILWRVGCGDKFKFWEDRWIGGDKSLARKYPRLYTISAQQHQFIHQIGAVKEGGWEWHFKWRRLLFDSEIGMAVAFLQQLEGFTIRSEINDHWKWAAKPSGCYSTKSAYKAIHHVTMEDGQDGKFKELWKLRVPLKVAIFAWRLIQDKLPTKVNLKKKRVELQE
ncbi:putative ribonuclease H protein [Glycine soja]